MARYVPCEVNRRKIERYERKLLLHYKLDIEDRKGIRVGEYLT